MKYYLDKRDASSAVIVKEYQLVEMYDITDRWYTIKLFLENGETVLIHSMYLQEMQKTTFVSDMEKQSKIVK